MCYITLSLCGCLCASVLYEPLNPDCKFPYPCVSLVTSSCCGSWVGAFRRSVHDEAPRIPQLLFLPGSRPPLLGKKGNTKQISTPKLPSILFEEPFSSHCLRCIVSPSQSSLLLSERYQCWLCLLHPHLLKIGWYIWAIHSVQSSKSWTLCTDRNMFELLTSSWSSCLVLSYWLPPIFGVHC